MFLYCVQIVLNIDVTISVQMVFPYRGDFYDVHHLKVAGDLGQVVFCPYHLCDEASIAKAVKHSHVVVNLVGRDWNTMNFNMEQVQLAFMTQSRTGTVILHLPGTGTVILHLPGTGTVILHLQFLCFVCSILGISYQSLLLQTQFMILIFILW